MNEEWRWIEGYEDLYQISNLGRLKGFRRDKAGYIRSNTQKDGWYLSVTLKDHDGASKSYKIHTLVAKTFIGDIPKGYHVHHKDGNRQNNVVSNLEIIHPRLHWRETEKQNHNVIDGILNHNRYVRPKRVRQFSQDGFLLAEYVNCEVASRMTGICQRNILQVAGKTEYKPGKTRSQAGGYVWKYANESEVI